MAKEKVETLEAKEAIVIVVGARPIQWERRIVRHNRTGELVEVDVHELPPVDPGAEGLPYVFKRGEKVRSDHPAVIDCPGAFVKPLED